MPVRCDEQVGSVFFSAWQLHLKELRENRVHMEEVRIEGYVERIIFRNEENGYTVISITDRDGEEQTCFGYFSLISEGEYVEVTGVVKEHPSYGEQIQVSHYEIKEPDDALAMERYLGSGAIKGIGTALAARIVRKFGEETFRIMEQEPERLAEVKGISTKMAMQISTQFEEKREVRNATVFLQKYGISLNLAVKIHNTYGAGMYEIIRDNPYKLAEDIAGVGFKIADEIAMKVGIDKNSSYRIQAGIYYLLQQASTEGHVYLPKEELVARAQTNLTVDKELIEENINNLSLDNRIVMKSKVIKDVDFGFSGEEKKKEEQICVYTSNLYYTELNCARMLTDFCVDFPVDETLFARRLKELEESDQVVLDEKQRFAVHEAVRSGLVVITGGPGTGKTTTIQTILHFLRAEGLDILLAAPTGRAAKRMSEATGYEAQTIHRMLELNGNVEEESSLSRFERNENNPLETDVIIIDEMSMVDIHLLYALLKAVVVGTRLIFVGDANQLPSVGPGNVLKDIIASGCFPTVILDKIFRQARESDIIVNAHKINAGQPIQLDNKSRDFFLLHREDTQKIINVTLQLVLENMPKYVHAKPEDIQVLTPMRKGDLGVEHLNEVLQQFVNPPGFHKQEKKHGTVVFREGDKVMQIKNNYRMHWEIRTRNRIVLEEGDGIFNGDCGIIQEINTFSEELVVLFDEVKTVTYKFSELDELELAYAITIHKSQGSEYPAVVIPLLSGPKMLFNRNLLYTAVTRARQCVVIVGSRATVENMIQNVNENKRYSSLKENIQEMRGY